MSLPKQIPQGGCLFPKTGEFCSFPWFYGVISLGKEAVEINRGLA
ncbi:MAG: hypothetical protein U0903_08735 [Planctomycetales bacterium]